LKLIRCSNKGRTFFGVWDDKNDIVREIKSGKEISDEGMKVSELKFLTPCQPSKIVAVGLNYRDHAEEMKLPLPQEPVLFLKPSTAIIAHDEEIIYPSMSKRVDYEAELGVVIKKRAKNVTEKEARDYILGYTCFNDVTARDLQKKDGQYTRAKGFDTFAPLGPCIETSVDPVQNTIESFVNGERRQLSNTKEMIFSVPYLISFISHVMTLLPGDVIATGTPAGIGPLNTGDIVEVRIEGIGTLQNKVVQSGL
jgi:2-keto-4-pentenoate hydratase/2-oxohepta-3-ene-1,7-dioic acid hydratase in catechol pathway